MQDDGLFGDPGNRGDLFNGDVPFAKSHPRIVVTGAEFSAPDTNVGSLRREVTAWYSDMQAQYPEGIMNEASGRIIKFGTAGKGKIGSGKGVDLLRMVPGLPDILRWGEFVGEAQPDLLGRKGGVIAVHRLMATVEHKGRSVDVVVIIRETPQGEFFYDLRKNNREGARWAVSSVTAEGLTPKGQVPHPALESDSFAELNLDYADGGIKERRTTPGVRFAYEPTSGFSAKAKAIVAALQRRLDSLKLPGLRVGIVERLFVRDKNGDLIELDGLANPDTGLIAVALAATRGVDVTLGHEALHMLKAAGLFRDAEWAALVKAARADTDRMARAQLEYEELSEAGQIEEVIADMLGEWWAGRSPVPKGFLRTAYERLRAFIEALGRALRGQDFHTWESVFSSVERGDVGRRYKVGKPIGDGSGVAVVGETKGRDGILAYHGSPHDFDRFDISKIGTGEGAQAFGHGLYFAENEGVARSYRDMRAEPDYSDRRLVGETLFDVLSEDSMVDGKVPFGRDRALFSREEMADAFNAHRMSIFSVEDSVRRKVDARLIEPGHMYEVRIDADPDEFLDWGKPLSEQSELVRSAFAALRESSVPAGAEGLDGANSASAGALRGAGIKGIRYLDQGSRASGEGTSNYVVFDDSLVTVTGKYAKARPDAASDGNGDAFRSSQELGHHLTTGPFGEPVQRLIKAGKIVLHEDESTLPGGSESSQTPVKRLTGHEIAGSGVPFGGTTSAIPRSQHAWDGRSASTGRACRRPRARGRV